jgi:WD40 repeat protein
LIQVWSAANTGELLVCHQGHTGPVTCLTLDANWLFSGSSDTTINCWDLLPACAKEAAFGLGSAAFAGKSELCMIWC